jgi:signal transduction histidine kinase
MYVYTTVRRLLVHIMVVLYDSIYTRVISDQSKRVCACLHGNYSASIVHKRAVGSGIMLVRHACMKKL